MLFAPPPLDAAPRVHAAADAVLSTTQARRWPCVTFVSELARICGSLTTASSHHASASAQLRDALVELDRVRGAAVDLKRESDEALTLLTSAEEDAETLRADISVRSARVARAERDHADALARVAGLDAAVAVGAAWSADQVGARESLEKSREQATALLDVKRAALVAARSTEAHLMQGVERALAAKASVDTNAGAAARELDSLREELRTGARAKETLERSVASAQVDLSRVTREATERLSEFDAGVSRLSDAQDLLRREKELLDGGARDVERLTARAAKLAAEVDTTLSVNHEAAKELELAMSEVSRLTSLESRTRAAIGKAEELIAATGCKKADADAALAETMSRTSTIRARITELDDALLAATRSSMSAEEAVEDARREKEALAHGLTRAGDKARAASAAVAYQTATERALIAEVDGYAASVRRLKLEAASVRTARDVATARSDVASGAIATLTEALSMQDAQTAALEARVSDVVKTAKRHESATKALTAERRDLSHKLEGASSDAKDLRDRIEFAGAEVRDLKDGIIARDKALVSAHLEHSRVNRAVLALHEDISRLRVSAAADEELLGAQTSETVRLRELVTTATAERARVTTEVSRVRADRDVLLATFTARQRELEAAYSKLRALRTAQGSGAAAYVRAVSEREALATRVSELKGSLSTASAGEADAIALREEVAALERDFAYELSREVALTAETNRPLHLHRWRDLAARDPAHWAQLQHVHELQKQLLELRDARDSLREPLEVATREAAAARALAAKAPSNNPDHSDTLAALAAELKAKAHALAQVEEQREAAAARCAEWRAEGARTSAAIESLGAGWIRAQAAAAATARREGAGGGGRSTSRKRGVGAVPAGGVVAVGLHSARGGEGALHSLQPTDRAAAAAGGGGAAAPAIEVGGAGAAARQRAALEVTSDADDVIERLAYLLEGKEGGGKEE